jgi:hypothetical protein
MPTFAKGFAHLGLCKAQLGYFDEAITAYKEVNYAIKLALIFFILDIVRQWN